MSDPIQDATEAYVACALHFALDHKGSYRGVTASDVLDIAFPYKENMKEWHAAACLVADRGEEALALIESSEGTKRCHSCNDRFRRRAGESFSQFRRRVKCYTCEAQYVKACTVCGTEYSKPPRRSLKSWETSRYCGRGCQNA